jgi:plasmid stabilization system protein ParE
MRQYSVSWDPRAARELTDARAWLGSGRAVELNDELRHVRERLGAFPEMAPPVRLRGTWSTTVRRLVLIRNPYHLYYRVNHEAERIVVLSLWHERRRPPRL